MMNRSIGSVSARRDSAAHASPAIPPDPVPPELPASTKKPPAPPRPLPLPPRPPEPDAPPLGSSSPPGSPKPFCDPGSLGLHAVEQTKSVSAAIKRWRSVIVSSSDRVGPTGRESRFLCDLTKAMRAPRTELSSENPGRAIARRRLAQPGNTFGAPSKFAYRRLTEYRSTLVGRARSTRFLLRDPPPARPARSRAALVRRNLRRSSPHRAR